MSRLVIDNKKSTRVQSKTKKSNSPCVVSQCNPAFRGRGRISRFQTSLTQSDQTKRIPYEGRLLHMKVCTSQVGINRLQSYRENLKKKEKEKKEKKKTPKKPACVKVYSHRLKQRWNLEERTNAKAMEVSCLLVCLPSACLQNLGPPSQGWHHLLCMGWALLH